MEYQKHSTEYSIESCEDINKMKKKRERQMEQTWLIQWNTKPKMLY